MPIRVIISDTELTGHPETVRTAINTGYGSDISDQIEIRAETLTSSLVYCGQVGGVMVVRSVSDMTGNINNAEPYWPLIATVMPMGSNSPVEINPPTSVPVIITTGTTGSAYGPGLEFIDDDLGVPGAASSWSNGIIAGKLLKIKDLTGFDWWQVRYIARQTASNGGTRNDLTGYGVISTVTASGWAGGFTDDPYTEAIEIYDAWNQALMAIKRETILSAVKTRLATITTGNGYYTSIGSHVYDWKTEEWAAQELPGVSVRDLTNTRVDAGNSQKGVFYYDLGLEIQIAHEGLANNAMATYLRKAIEDVKAAFRTDLTFSSTVMAATYESDTIEIEPGDKVRGNAKIEVTLRYFTDSWKEE